MEAQAMVQSEIDGQMTVLWKCVADFRTRVNDAQREVLVDVGIDQDGALVAVKTATPRKGDLEPALKDCLSTALRGRAFPRSGAGFITVRESFREPAVSP
jgi:hypothetical protein